MLYAFSPNEPQNSTENSTENSEPSEEQNAAKAPDKKCLFG